MKVLAITNMYPTGDRPWMGTFVEQQVESLRRAGVDVEVLFIDRRTEGARTYYRMGGRIEAAMKRFRPDVVHVMYGGVMAAESFKSVGKTPVFVTFHGSDLLGENLSGWIRKLISHYGVRCSWKAATRAAGIVAVARHLERALPRSVSREKVEIIPCGIDLRRFQPMDPVACRRELTWEKSKFHVLFPANAGDPVKRPWLAEAAVAEAVRMGVPAQLHRLSGVPYGKVPVWVNGCHVLILTSLHEGSPTVVKEALACHRPIVSVDVGDVQERLAGVDGCFVADSNPAALGICLKRVYESGAAIQPGKALEAIDVDRIAQQLIAFYSRILAAGSHH